MSYICKSIENTVKICALSIWGAYTIVATALVAAAYTDNSAKTSKKHVRDYVNYEKVCNHVRDYADYARDANADNK